MDKMDMESQNLVNVNIEKIAELFPNCVTETEKGKAIDFDMLKQELSEDIVEGQKEKYQLTWPGKKEAIVTANTPTTNTLRPVREKSVDFDNTQNIYIEGDNLEALKILQESYLDKIKCIYIDPPYNTGNDFVYNDNFYKKSQEELKESGIIDENGAVLVSKIINTDTNGRFHSDWLSMMYPRLKLARNLLAKDGIIFISIDYHELDNLKKICDEIFGSNNFLCYMPRKTVEHMRVLADYELQTLNDYVLMYCKSKADVLIIKKIIGMINYEYEDENGKYTLKAFQNSGANGTRSARPNLYYPIYYNLVTKELSLDKKDGMVEILPHKVGNDDGRWLWSKEKFINDNQLLEVKNGHIYRKSYFNEEDDQNKYQTEKTWLEEYPNRLGASELNNLGLKGTFDYSKPVELIKFLMKISTTAEDIILDFFSGSATTAQAVMELNVEDDNSRKFIMIQLPELCDEKSEFNNICELGEERIRRASQKLNKSVGFRVYKVASSNMKDVYYKPNEINQSQMDIFTSNIKEDRTPEDILTQIILDWGLTLDLPIEEKNVNDNKVFYVAGNSLVACLDERINIDIIDEIAKCEPLRVVFRDEAFTKDSDKINAYERLKKLSPKTEIKVI